MTDPTQNQPPVPNVPSHEELAALKPFQDQLAWIDAQAKQAGRASRDKELTELLGMPPDQAVQRLREVVAAGKPPTTTAPTSGEPNAEIDAIKKQMAEMQKQQDEREAKLTERETTIKTTEQDMLKVSALVAAGMSQEQAQQAKSMMPMPDGVTELTADLAAASAEKLRATWPLLFPPPEGGAGGQNGNPAPGQQGGSQTPPNTHTPGTQRPPAASGGQSATDRARARLVNKGLAKPTS